MVKCNNFEGWYVLNYRIYVQCHLNRLDTAVAIQLIRRTFELSSRKAFPRGCNMISIAWNHQFSTINLRFSLVYFPHSSKTVNGMLDEGGLGTGGRASGGL